MRKTFTAKYNYGDKVRLKTEPDGIHVVTGYVIRVRSVSYLLKKDGEETVFEDNDIEPIKIFTVKGFR